MKTELKMETCMQTGCGKIATDLQVTVPQNEATGDSDLQLNDEVEELSNSLRAVIQDETVRPKLQCLMMDPSFSMVTVQSEDSGILWETASSQCSTPWTSEASTRGGNIFFGEGECYKTPTSRNAGKIIFIMDEVHTVRKKRDKAPKSDEKNTVASQDLNELTDRPAMVEVSMPNMKDEQNKQEEMADPREEKEQRLFRLVSEGSEILNIVVPPKVATLDEEESKDLVDNLAYMEESLTFQAYTEPADIEEHVNCPDMVISEPGPEQTCTQSMKKELQEDIVPALPGKVPQTGTVKDTDYFDMFTLLDEQAPGGSDRNEEKDHEPHKEETSGLKMTEVEPFMKTKVTPKDLEDPISCGEIASELLDEVFYGGTEDHNHSESVEGCQKDKDEVSKCPRKESGSALFDNEDTVLTPIFISEGPPKIIDPSLLEEPKAMAFLYTDLYEDAVGTRKREEDTVSISSEKSFHSKDSESDCYLEKFVLKDETPLVEMAQASSASNTHGFKVWSEEKFELAKLTPSHEEPEKDTEEEITDFFRNSNSSSPCNDIEQPNLSLEENIDVKCRKVLFEDEVKQNNKQLTLNQESGNSLEKALEENEMTELEEPLTDTTSPADEIYEISEKWQITSKDALVGHKSNTGPELQLAFAEQQAVSKPPRSSLGLTSLDPAETEEDLREGEVTETEKEGECGEVESEHSKEEEKDQGNPPVTVEDTNIPPSNFTGPEELSDPVALS